MQDFVSLWATFGVWFYELLPNSPFAQFNSYISDVIQHYLKWLNWFIPVDWIWYIYILEHRVVENL